MTTYDPFAGIEDEEPLSADALKRRYFEKVKRKVTPVRQVFVQKQKAEAVRPSTLALFISAKQHAALDLYLLLLALEPVVVESPISLQLWATLLGKNKATTASAFKTLQDMNLVHRDKGATPYRVRPLLEDASEDDYQRPSGGAEFKQWYFSIPIEYWTDGWDSKLPLAGKAMMLVLLAGTSKKPSQQVAATQVKEWYGFSERTAERGYRELREAHLTREHPQWVVDTKSPINARLVHHRAFNEPWDTATRLARQTESQAAVKRIQGKISGNSETKTV